MQSKVRLNLVQQLRLGDHLGIGHLLRSVTTALFSSKVVALHLIKLVSDFQNVSATTVKRASVHSGVHVQLGRLVGEAAQGRPESWHLPRCGRDAVLVASGDVHIHRRLQLGDLSHVDGLQSGNPAAWPT